MNRRKFSPREIVDQLQTIDAMTADGWTLAEALRFVGAPAEDYEKWRSDYAGLLRTLGPLASAPPSAARARRRPAGGRRGEP